MTVGSRSPMLLVALYVDAGITGLRCDDSVPQPVIESIRKGVYIGLTMLAEQIAATSVQNRNPTRCFVSLSAIYDGAPLEIVSTTQLELQKHRRHTDLDTGLGYFSGDLTASVALDQPLDLSAIHRDAARLKGEVRRDTGTEGDVHVRPIVIVARGAGATQNASPPTDAPMLTVFHVLHRQPNGSATSGRSAAAMSLHVGPNLLSVCLIKAITGTLDETILQKHTKTIEQSPSGYLPQLPSTTDTLKAPYQQPTPAATPPRDDDTWAAVDAAVTGITSSAMFLPPDDT